MNKNYLILFIVVLAIVVYNCTSTTENMAMIKGRVFVKGDIVSKVFDLEPKKLSDNPIIEKKIIKTIVSEEVKAEVDEEAVEKKKEIKKLIEKGASPAKIKKLIISGEIDEETVDKIKSEIDEETIDRIKSEIDEEKLSKIKDEIVSKDKSNIIKKKIEKEILEEKLKKLNNEKYVIKKKRIGRLWEGKDLPVEKILDIIHSGLKVCDVNDIYLKKDDVSKFDSRKKFIKLIPIIKKKFRSKIDYDKIRCYVSKYEPDNYININKVQKNVPKIIPDKNSIIINDFLYYYSPYGVLKYKINPEFKIDTNANVINASFETTMINDINKYNSSDYRIVPYQGRLLQIKNGQFHNLITGQILDIKKIVNQQISSGNIHKQQIKSELEEKNVLDEGHLLRDKFFSRILYLLNYAGKLFIVQPKKVIPNIDIGHKINRTIKKNNIVIKGVIPHFFYNDDKFIVRFLFLCSSNFFFYIADDEVSELMDFKKVYGYNFGKEFDYKLSCKENKVILEQLVKANKMSNTRKNNILKRLKC